jgi:hypothetical protein
MLQKPPQLRIAARPRTPRAVPRAPATPPRNVACVTQLAKLPLRLRRRRPRRKRVHAAGNPASRAPRLPRSPQRARAESTSGRRSRLNESARLRACLAGS